MSSYSIDLFKRAAFEDELLNVLKLQKHADVFTSVVEEYLQKRMNEIDKEHGIDYDGQER
jgi:hypothetical protein